LDGHSVLKTVDISVLYVLEQAYPNGHIPTIPGEKGCVGYDPGSLLYALSRELD